MRLKSRTKFPPDGFKFTQPESNWSAPAWRSFDYVVRELIKHRKGNPHLVKKHNWATDYETVANQIDYYNAIRLSNAGYRDYIEEDGHLEVIPKTLRPRQVAPSNLEAVVGAGKRAAGGIKLVVDWLGQGARSVSQEQAESRGNVCIACPLNQEGNFWQRLEAKSAEALRATIEIKNNMELRTNMDDQLKSCAACDCWNPLKIWVPLENIKKHMSPEVRQQLHPSCWIFKEGG